MVRNEAGVWEVLQVKPREGQIYNIISRANGHQIMKIDPLAVYFEARPGTGSCFDQYP